MNTGVAIAAAVVLLFLNGFFVAVEFGLIAANRGRLERAAEDGNRRARGALAAMSDLSRQLAGAQLGITMTSLGLGFLAEPAVAHLLEDLFGGLLPESMVHTVSVIVALSIVVFLHLVVGEMVPKNLALAGADRTVMLLAPPHRVFVTVFSPLVWFLNGMANLGVRAMGEEVVDELGTAHTAQELVTLVDASKGHGLIDDFFHGLLSGAIEMRDRAVGDVVVPRDQVVLAAADAPVSDVIAIARRSGHSRIPLGGPGGVDAMTGFVHVKDLLRLGVDQVEQPVEESITRPMVVISPERTLEYVLRVMKRSQLHVAVVRNTDGTTAGIVTLEDVLEELVGPIVDETDRIRSVVRA